MYNYKIGQEYYTAREINAIANQVWADYSDSLKKADRRRLRHWRGKLNLLDLYVDKKETIVFFVWTDYAGSWYVEIPADRIAVLLERALSEDY